MNLTKLPTPQPCAIECSTPNDEAYCCRKPAHWSVDDTPVCHDDMRAMAGMNSDNAAFFAPALAESNLARYFAHIAENLNLIENELEQDLATIHTIEFTPHLGGHGWWMDANEKQFIWVDRDRQGRLEVVFEGHYSDYEEMYAQPTNA